ACRAASATGFRLACSSWAARSTRRASSASATPIRRQPAGTRRGHRIPWRGRPDEELMYIPDVVPESDLAMYRKANFGHPIGWGRKIAIIVVDMTRAFVEDRFALGSATMGQAALRGIAQLLTVARPIGIPVCFTRMVPFRSRTEAGRWY